MKSIQKQATEKNHPSLNEAMLTKILILGQKQMYETLLYR
jgi:hypothetical protein